MCQSAQNYDREGKSMRGIRSGWFIWLFAFSFLALFCACLFAADTLWVLRIKPGKTPPGISARDAFMIMLPDWRMVPAGEGKVNVWCSSLVRNSEGRVDTLSYKIRIWGSDTTKTEIVSTTDTVPDDWSSADYKLNPQGKFVKK